MKTQIKYYKNFDEAVEELSFIKPYVGGSQNPVEFAKKVLTVLIRCASLHLTNENVNSLQSNLKSLNINQFVKEHKTEKRTNVSSVSSKNSLDFPVMIFESVMDKKLAPICNDIIKTLAHKNSSLGLGYEWLSANGNEFSM